MDELVKRLDEIDEPTIDIQWIFKNGIWLKRNGCPEKLCDLVCVYYDKHVSCIELKGSRKKRRKARQQLYNSRLFVQNVLKYKDYSLTLKIAYYANGQYEYEEL